MILLNLTFSVSGNTPTSMANCIQCSNQRYFTQNIRLVCSTCQICFWVLRKCDLILSLEEFCISDSSVNSLALLCTTAVVHYITLFLDFLLKNCWLKTSSNVAKIEVFFALTLSLGVWIQHFEISHCLPLQGQDILDCLTLKMKALWSCETSGIIHPMAKRCIQIKLLQFHVLSAESGFVCVCVCVDTLLCYITDVIAVKMMPHGHSW